MNKRELVRLHKRLCKELGIKPCKLVFRGKSRRNWLGVYRPWDNTITLYLDTLKADGQCPREILAHEIRHLYQEKMGWCSGTWWKGTCYLDNWNAVMGGRAKYKDLPWEKDADRWARKITKREEWGRDRR